MKDQVIIICAWVTLFLGICGALYPIMSFWAADGIVPPEYVPQALVSSMLLAVPVLFIIRGSILLLIVTTIRVFDHDTTDER